MSTDLSTAHPPEGPRVAQPRDWLAGTRPRTLPAAVVPVLIGTGVAFGYGAFSAWRAGLALVVALALQIGVNYANDYSDGIRGSDERRIGPTRLRGWPGPSRCWRRRSPASAWPAWPAWRWPSPPPPGG
jgi:1,4-dihydroxy-2-naphthoate octaprenyltransferase